MSKDYNNYIKREIKKQKINSEIYRDASEFDMRICDKKIRLTPGT